MQFMYEDDEAHKMIRSSKVESPSKKKESCTSDEKFAKGSSSSSAQWLRLKDPRIVRVSRAFGGKDRHSKVRTIRGLRDRRVRLSVTTAIQLYDLQDRLGLNQPSKVVDWLLNAAKQEIDELPPLPLPLPPANLGLNYTTAVIGHSHEVGHSSESNKERFKMGNIINWEDSSELTRSNFWNSDSLVRGKSKLVAKDSADEKENWTEQSKHERHEGPGANSSTSFLLRTATPSSSSGLTINGVPYGSFLPPNFAFGGQGYAATQPEELHNLNVVPLHSTLSLSSGSQILFCPPGTTQSYFPSTEVDPRQINHFQMLNSSSPNLLLNPTTPSQYPINQSVRPFHFSMTTSRLFQSHSSKSPPDKDQDFPCK
ncbi:hypothetical protein K2173_019911 [Erythroxylum novogranatense]|uniref:TCP domain-containing protein n=1 Tax=Erythroxylum novogranatense TaxID=1862640 RepID=A0AAV8U6F7_9ROSI|nr:hypothetical protein K2173_019911 [Erythroxylum novogranatense]